MAKYESDRKNAIDKERRADEYGVADKTPAAPKPKPVRKPRKRQPYYDDMIIIIPPQLPFEYTIPIRR